MQEIKTNPTVRHTTPLQLLAAFAATVAVLFVLLLGACALPAQPVLEHVYDSAQTIQQEGLYPEYFGFKLFQMDNYTDTIMLFEAAAMGEQDPLTAMMTATAYNVDNFETMAGDLAVYCERTIPLSTGAQKAVQLVPFSYARYWHGYLIWLRPLLCVMSITGVRVVQYLVLFALLAVILWQLRRQCGLRAMVWFAVSQLAVTVFWVPHQVQYFTTFCIAYAGCAWVLARPRRAGQLSIALVVLGTCTAFCDLLVTPIITLGLPVAVWLCCLPQRAASGARQCLPVIGGSLCWGAGYAMCWGLKWVLASLSTGQDIIGDAIHQAGVRTTADTWHGMELSWGNIFRFVGDTLSQRGLLWPVVLVVILCIAAFLLCLRNKEALLRALPIGLTALMAPVWLALLRTHSIQHGWLPLHPPDPEQPVQRPLQDRHWAGERGSVLPGVPQNCRSVRLPVFLRTFQRRDETGGGCRPCRRRPDFLRDLYRYPAGLGAEERHQAPAGRHTGQPAAGGPGTVPAAGRAGKADVYPPGAGAVNDDRT